MPKLNIVAYTFLNICEKTRQFLSGIKRDAHRRKWFLFVLRGGVYVCVYALGLFACHFVLLFLM